MEKKVWKAGKIRKGRKGQDADHAEDKMETIQRKRCRPCRGQDVEYAEDMMQTMQRTG
jgi:hypothetical protein